MGKKPVVAVCGVVPVSAIVPVFPAGTYPHYRETTTVRVVVLFLGDDIDNRSCGGGSLG